MHVFIVRPFGMKSGIDFDEVERQIIRPVLDALPATTWGTTEEIAQSGNIRSDMMDLLLTADLVIADISIHNANVYYELGVRHALRHRPTILIRAKVDEVPFDLKTDRYLSYDLDDVATSQTKLRTTIEATLRSAAADSPVYQMIPSLEVRDGAEYLTTPREFTEAVDRARSTDDVARLALLSDEARSERWSLSGQRLVGRALYAGGTLRAAQTIWERVRMARPDDVEANLLLGTIYQRLDDLPRSDAALARVLGGDAEPKERAEALALQGRNRKFHWTASWRNEPDPEQRQRIALESGLLLDSLNAYRHGFLEDLNHYYPGLNSLALNVILIELARLHPDVWASKFDDQDEAEIKLRQQERRREQLAAATAIALEAAKNRHRQQGRDDPWLDLSDADHRLLTSDNLSYVQQAYRDATRRAPGGFTFESAALQLMLYVDLGVLAESAKAALAALGFPDGVPMQHAVPEQRLRVIVSSGHRIDAPGRSTPRFPPSAEGIARQAIADAVRHEIELAGTTSVIGLASLANGNDILFHEVAAELNVATTALLALPEEEFVARSVDGSASDWVERYRRLCARLTPEVMGDATPSWVSHADEDYAFQRCNMWLVEKAFAYRNPEVTLIALWNGAEGDGSGGTADMVSMARERGAKIVVLDTNQLFGLPQPSP